VSKQFWIFLVAGLGVVGALIFFMLSVTSGAHLRLEGKVLKVRVLALPNNKASLVMVDFRATNPSDVLLVVGSVKLRLQPAQGDPVEGQSIAKSDIATVFQYEKLLGPKYNEVLASQDRIGPHQSGDHMAGARFEMPEADVNARRGLSVIIEDVDDGTVAEFVETH
jgi:hypothetical protein